MKSERQKTTWGGDQGPDPARKEFGFYSMC